MRTEERLRKLKEWTYRTVCEGRKMKTPAPNGDVTKIVRQEPKVYLGFMPRRRDQTGYEDDPLNAAPGIWICPGGGDVRFQEEKRFDRYNNVHREQDMGQSLVIQNIFMVYEDGVRLPGFIDDPSRMDLIMEGTEEGLFTLTNWLDDYKDALLSAGTIPGTDLSVNEEQFTYDWYSDQKYIADRRPLFTALVTVKFQCYADHLNKEVNDLLR